MASSHDPWLNKRHPEKLDSRQDQMAIDPDVFRAFKGPLLQREPPMQGTNYFSTGPESVRSLLTSQNTQLSFPVNLVDPSMPLPTPEEVEKMRLVFLTEFKQHCSFLCNVPTELFISGPRYLALSLGSLGCLFSAGTARWESFWTLANKALISTMAIDNTQTRNFHVIASWLALGTVGALSSTSSIWRSTNCTHGLLETILKKYWDRTKSPVPHDSEDQTRPSDIIFHCLLIDILRSLHYGMPATNMTSFVKLDLGPPLGSIADLLASTIFGGPTTPWPNYTRENALSTLILILDRIIHLARQIAPAVHKIIGQNHSVMCPYFPSPETEFRGCRIRLSRALSKWEEEYFTSSAASVQALFFFCKLHLAVPDMHRLAHMTSYKPATQFKQNFSQSTPELLATDEGTHYAWLVLEKVSESENLSSVWLPVITFFSALVVWADLKAQKNSRVHGSPYVLRLFVDLLQKMVWPCCSEMGSALEELIQDI